MTIVDMLQQMHVEQIPVVECHACFHPARPLVDPPAGQIGGAESFRGK